MASVNKVILVGNVGKDPELRTFDSGTTKASFSLATSETYKNREGEKVTNTEWHNLVVWGNLTKVVEQFVRKGSQIYVEGKLTSRSYETDGITKYITEVRVNDLVLLGRREDAEARSTQSENTSKPESPAPASDDSPAEADDLPF
ncbi:MAG: single-stranded DNA-binding protein [Bacteroidetes bacterium]|nr:single-stranded DNA-binding protein [Bacteroidota bacterium]